MSLWRWNPFRSYRIPALGKINPSLQERIDPLPLLQLTLQFCSSWCKIAPSEVVVQMPSGVDSLRRFFRDAIRRRSLVSTAIGSIAFVAVALLIVTVEVLATEARLPNPGQNTASWHTSKSSRMVESGGDEWAPVQTEDTRPAPLVVPHETVRHQFTPLELPLPEVVRVPQSHGLRAPPLV